MVKRNIKWLLVVLVLGLCPSILHAEDPYGEMKALADSAQKVLGQDRLPSINARWIKLARELNDTVQISDAHNNLISHYYQLGDIDQLKAATYEYMDWCRKYQPACGVDGGNGPAADHEHYLYGPGDRRAEAHYRG